MSDRVSAQIAAINEDGMKCWLVIHAARFDFNPARMEDGAPLSLGDHTPMDRFAFQVDGFTQLDAELLPDHNLRILYNGCQVHQRRMRNFDEDDAFRGPEFNPGAIVDWLDMRQGIRNYISLANRRVNPNYRTKWETRNEVATQEG